MYKSILEPDRPQTTIWRMRIACCITKATNTRSEYVIFIAFPVQKWLRERASMLRYSKFPVLFYFVFGATISAIHLTLTSP